LAFSSNRTSKKTGFPQSGREQEENAIAAAARQKEPLRKKKGEKKYVINLVLVIICLRLVFRNNDAFLHFFRCKTKLSILKSSGALLCENISTSVWICPRLKNKKKFSSQMHAKRNLIASELFLIVQFLLCLNAILIQSGVIVVVVAAVACLINNTTLAFISS
jgi:hypothetical protein